MKLIFIKHRTLEASIAKALIEEGYEVHFITLNKRNQPKVGIVHQIPYPKRNKIDQNPFPHELKEIITSDRQVSFFGLITYDHFRYYQNKIINVIEQVKPDVVFGEAASFDDLLASKYCKENGILFLNPMTCRFPAGRFSFYQYDTLEPFLGSGDRFSKDEAKEYIEAIVNRKAKPDYMKKKAFKKPSLKVTLKDRAFKIIDHYKGDKNIPNPFIYQKLVSQRKKNVEKWNKFSTTNLKKDTRTFYILYPLQMQPEANLDVYGREFKNQTNLIKKLAKIIPEHAKILVKPNPKSNLELTSELVNFSVECEKIILLHHSLPMAPVFAESDLILTVTGTVAIEAILAGKPVASFKQHFFKNEKACFILDTFTDVPEVVRLVERGAFPILNQEEKVNYLNKLSTTSYKGNFNPFDLEDLGNIISSFKRLLMQVKEEKHESTLYKEEK